MKAIKSDINTTVTNKNIIENDVSKFASLEKPTYLNMTNMNAKNIATKPILATTMIIS